MTGPREQMSLRPEERKGRLWDAYRELQNQAPSVGSLDAKDFATAFMVKGSEELLAAWALRQSHGVKVTVNLGKVHVIVRDKAEAARHILELEGIGAESAVAMLDDDNDIQLAEMCGAGAYVIGVTHTNLAAAIERNKHRGWLVAPLQGPLATEFALEAIIARAKRSEGSNKL